MTNATKRQLAKFSLYVITCVCFALVVATAVGVFMVTFDLQPFKQRTAGFLGMSFGAAIGLAAGALVLNIAANLSLIAEAKAGDQAAAPDEGFWKRWVAGLLAVTFLICAVVAGGDALSKRRWLRVINAQVDELVGAHSALIERLSTGLKSDSYAQVADDLKFLQSQRKDLPGAVVVFSRPYKGTPANHWIGGWESNSRSDWKKYEPPYYECAKELDCDYLKRFFAGETLDRLKHVKESEYAIYVPIEGPGARCMLIFSKMQRYGKFGSY